MFHIVHIVVFAGLFSTNHCFRSYFHPLNYIWLFFQWSSVPIVTQNEVLWLTQKYNYLSIHQSWQWDSCGCPSGPVNYHSGTVGGGRWNAKASVSSTVHTTESTGGTFETEHSGMYSERGAEQARWYNPTESRAYLIAARMLNYVVKRALKWSLQHKQAMLANMTPLKERRTFTGGLTNHIYLFCVNSSDVWNAIVIHPLQISEWRRKLLTSECRAY